MVEAESLWFVGPREVEIRTETVADPGRGEVLVESLFSGISRGTEMLVYRNEVPEDMEPTLPLAQGSFPYPVKYGYSNVGTVKELGEAVRRVDNGDVVFCLAPHSTHYKAPEDALWVLPQEIDPKLGVFLANLETAIGITHDSNIHLAEAVCVFGLGVVGLLTVQLLQKAGGESVVGVDPIEERRKMAAIMGATEAEPGDATGIVDEVTDGRGADVVVESSGSPAALSEALEVVAEEGVVIVASWYGDKHVSLPLGRDFHAKRTKLVSSNVSRVKPSLKPRWSKERRMRYAVGLLDELRLEEMVDPLLPFRQAPTLYSLMDDKPEEVLQAVLSYGEG